MKDFGEASWHGCGFTLVTGTSSSCMGAGNSSLEPTWAWDGRLCKLDVESQNFWGFITMHDFMQMGGSSLACQRLSCRDSGPCMSHELCILVELHGKPKLCHASVARRWAPKTCGPKRLGAIGPRCLGLVWALKSGLKWVLKLGKKSPMGHRPNQK